MDRVAAMLILLGLLVTVGLLLLALFAVAPVICSCIVTLLYTLYLFIANEESAFHHAQEFENRFWTIFTLLLTTALFFANDSPLAFGQTYPSFGFLLVLLAAYGMHMWDRHQHRKEISKQPGLRRGASAAASLVRLNALGIPVEELLQKINSCLADIDQVLLPSTINNYLNLRFFMQKEREIIKIFEEAQPKALNYLISHCRLGLIFYKVKDHRSFNGKHRTELIELLAVNRISVLTVYSKVVVLHALQMMKLPANVRAEYWVRNIILCTTQDDLSELKTLTDAKGNYYSMNKLIFHDIKSQTVREDILQHFKKQADILQAHMTMRTKRSKLRMQKAWRKVLSDVDDTLTCSGGSYPAGIDKRFGKKVVYPGVLAFYRELDLGTRGPEEWQEGTPGNLVFISARPHFYKDVSEKHNFAKFEKMRARGEDGKSGMHTIPSLLAGDMASGREYIVSNDMEPLAVKKYDNFKSYVSIYPEFKHVFIGDNGQGDVRAGELMFDSFPQHLEALYIHVVQPLSKTHGYAPTRWSSKGLKPCFFRTYVDAALDAVTRNPPLIRLSGLKRVCQDAVSDFYMITTNKWPSENHKSLRREELNQALWSSNQYLNKVGEGDVPLLEAERVWKDGQKIRTPYGIGTILSFDPTFDMYRVELDWRPLNVQVGEKIKNEQPKERPISSSGLETVVETVEEVDEDNETELATQPDSIGALGSSSKSDITELVDEKDNRKSTQDEFVQASESEQGAKDKQSENPAPNALEERPVHPIIATVQGRQIKMYTPPSMPVLSQGKGRSIFSFFGTGGEEEPFKPGAKCTTPFGPATIVEHRQKKRVVVVDMIGWSARAYLREDCIKIISKGILTSLLRRMTSSDDISPAKRPVITKEVKEKEIEFPYAKGITIRTPFGEGIVTRPLPLPTETGDAKQSDVKDTLQESNDLLQTSKQTPTMGICLTSWKLANGCQPIVYCTHETAREWKDAKPAASGLLSAFGSLVSTTVKMITAQQEKPPPPSPPIISYERYFQDGSAVTTLFGDGVVRSFRETDGIYVVSLVRWNMIGSRSPTAYLQKDALTYRLAKGCHEGCSVLTSLGLSGRLASVEPKTGALLV
eukprot:scaffold2680_cov57-Attheya_sp.AAC.1